MMIIRMLFLVFVLIGFGKNLSAQVDETSTQIIGSQLSVIENEDTLKISANNQPPLKHRESKRLTAAILCLTLGPFGMHRLYLGTSPEVAAAYSVTLGAIGIVPVVDFLLITFSKDISRFKNNKKVIMWGR